MSRFGDPTTDTPTTPSTGTRECIGTSTRRVVNASEGENPDRRERLQRSRTAEAFPISEAHPRCPRKIHGPLVSAADCLFGHRQRLDGVDQDLGSSAGSPLSAACSRCCSWRRQFFPVPRFRLGWRTRRCGTSSAHRLRLSCPALRSWGIGQPSIRQGKKASRRADAQNLEALSNGHLPWEPSRTRERGAGRNCRSARNEGHLNGGMTCLSHRTPQTATT